MCVRLLRMFLVIFSDFKGIVKFDKLQWKPPMLVFTRSVQWESSCSMRTVRGRTGRYDVANSRSS
jgi:hypothetical protein